MSNDTEAARRRAEESYRQNQQAQMANEQTIRNAEARNAHNAEIARQRAATQQSTKKD